jgi:hypothetical protein
LRIADCGLRIEEGSESYLIGYWLLAIVIRGEYTISPAFQ